MKEGGESPYLFVTTPPRIFIVLVLFLILHVVFSHTSLFKGSSLVCSIIHVRFSLRKSCFNGVNKSVSEGRSNQAVGESGWYMGTMVIE